MIFLGCYIAGAIIYLFVLSILAAREEGYSKEDYQMMAAMGVLVWPLALVIIPGNYFFNRAGPWVLKQREHYLERKALKAKVSEEDKLNARASLITKDYRSLKG